MSMFNSNATKATFFPFIFAAFILSCSAESGQSSSGELTFTPQGIEGDTTATVDAAILVTGGSNAREATAPNPTIVPANPVNPCAVEPVVLFVIDGSGSMCAPFGGSTRWQSLRSTLLDQSQGLIYRLQDRGLFGLLLFDGTIDPMTMMNSGGGRTPGPECAFAYAMEKGEGPCPLVVEVPTALYNAKPIDDAFPATELGGSTPTDKAMNRAVDKMITVREAGLDTEVHPQYIILATDGQPNDICAGGMGGDGTAQRQGVIAAVDRAAQSGISTFVISLAGGDQALESHLDEVARHGAPDNPDAHTYSPTTPEDLVATLEELLRAAFGCEIV